MNKNKGTNIFSPKGEELSVEKIKEYMSVKKYLIRKIKSSPNYNKQLEWGDLSEYNEILKEMQLRDENGNPIDDETIYQMFNLKNTEKLEDEKKRKRRKDNGRN